MDALKRLLGQSNEAEVKRLQKIADKVLAKEDEYKALSDSELRAKTDEFKGLVQGGMSLDDILPDAFAAFREAVWRVDGKRLFPVQIMGGICLHQGRIAEMKTGEGKTHTATLPAYLIALTGEGVHIVTVNDYLAKFQGEWMGNIFRFMGMTVGVIVHDMDNAARRAAYACDVTYGTNNEMGFDYLRDNMVIRESDMVQRGHAFGIVDEVDSILIDEARTPLIISGQGDQSTDLYEKADRFVSRLQNETDYTIAEKEKAVTLTEQGVDKAQKAFGVENIADLDNAELYHYILNALKAHAMMKRDVDYVVQNGEVVIVDEFTGRLMVGRRYSDGLHQAIEAKEHVKVERESKTLATVTFQNYFRMYNKISGMTGTAKTEEDEFQGIYNLDVVQVPTNRPMIRKDLNDMVYKTKNGKFKAVVEEIVKRHATGQPILVGTVNVETSEMLSHLIDLRGVPHEVLNAKNHSKEAEIVAQAGHVGAVTIATNMAGRGTDIMLGGNAEYLARNDLKKHGCSDETISEVTGFSETEDENIIAARKLYAERLKYHKEQIAGEADQVRQAGGLYIIGTERHDSRRIDNQLRGRAGRQGDPGESRFYLAMTDDIMRLFGSERVLGMMESMGLDEDTPLDYKILTNAIEQAQKTVESRNFQSRKSVLEYDDVMNVQRNVIYEQRRKVLDGDDLQSSITSMIEEYISSNVADGMGGHGYFDNATQLEEAMQPFEKLFLRKGEIKADRRELEHMTAHDLTEKLMEKAMAVYGAREKDFGLLPDGKPLMRELERVIMLRVVDEYWMDHIDAMQELRRGIGLRAYGNNNPIDAYKREGFDMFEDMIAGIRSEVVRRMFTVQVKKEQTLERTSVAKGAVGNVGGDASVKKQPAKAAKKPGRNDPCPCGKKRPNGLPMKYKDCCGRDE